MRGRRSSDSAGTVSRSSGGEGADAVEEIEVREDGTRGGLALDLLDAFDPLAESTAAICARSNSGSLAVGASSARDAR
jgi:hypothetical protein